ncbi:recombinase family protein [Pseudodesulfovibrio karagichevae]|uniref:Recombinase family protein n=1 Tax=Pseudodesulfovibrio karagichevae TaxID=3239305 RepID=A0ABV4K0N9_9BACT
MNGNFISYLRVSTQKQGRSGLGIEAQREAVNNYLNGGNWELLGEFVEVESGKKDDRKELAKALERCKLTGATLVIAKLDRLSRDAHFLLGLEKSRVSFVCVDMPDANNFTVGIMALVAQQEREMISKRTREALAAAKARGVKLGCPNGAAHLRHYGNELGVRAIKENADARAESLRATVEDIQRNGVVSFTGIAKELNSQKIKTARGGKWHPSSVKRLLERLI